MSGNLSIESSKEMLQRSSGRYPLIYSGAKSCLGIKCDLLVRLIVPEIVVVPLWCNLASADCSDCLIFGFTLFFHFVHFEQGQRSKLSGRACFVPVPTRGLINKTIYA
jgi:hypothetical protein